MKITTEDIQVGFHARQILKGISIESKDKELVGIIGPNGSGKSTLLKCIYRILKPDAGAVYLDGQELHSMSVKSSARKMAVVAQHNYYNFDFTVREVVLMGRAPHKKALERDNAKDYRIVEEALKTVQMDAFADRTFSTLSGGEQQRVILARALAQQTPALILDEPTNHLDMRTKDVLKQAIRDFNGTVILVSHDREFLDGLVSKVYEFGGGQVREHLGGIYDFLESRKLDSLRELEQRATVSKTEKDGNISKDSASPAKSEDSKLSYGEQKEFARRLRKAEKVVADIESEIAGLEKRIAEVEEKLATPDGAADTSLYELHGQLKKQLDDVMWKWSEASEVLDKLQK